MKKKTINLILLLVVAAVIAGGGIACACGVEMYATFWGLVPPIIAIGLALITKEVYSSLFVGIVAGALFYTGFKPVSTVDTMFQEGFISCLADSWDVGILIFLVLLGVLVALVNKAGGSAAYGRWAAKRIKGQKGALAASFGLGCLIFVDDYFNCLTVGSVMRPITDSHKVSRAKLAYIIDATAAPICMIAPISSWAAAVSGMVEGMNGLQLFIQAIPYNFYSLLTIVMIVAIIAMKFDFGPIKKCEEAAAKGDLGAVEDNTAVETGSKGKVIDLVLPVVALILSCICCMAYTGGLWTKTATVAAAAQVTVPAGTAFISEEADTVTMTVLDEDTVLTLTQDASADYDGEAFDAQLPADVTLSLTGLIPAEDADEGAKLFLAEGMAATTVLTNDAGEELYLYADTDVTAAAGTAAAMSKVGIADAFANCDAALALAVGAFLALIFTFLMYIPRKVLTLTEFMECLPAGFKAMVPPILILTFAWTLGGITGLLGADVYVEALVDSSAAGFQMLLPAIIFLVAAGLAFATGTSWGTFSILIPIIVKLQGALGAELMLIGISACLAGAVCGDHCSPISDTTIMASSGAQCNHISHVSTQLPYALLVAAVSFVTYIISGFIQNAWICLPIGIALMLGTLFVLKAIQSRKQKAA